MVLALFLPEFLVLPTVVVKAVVCHFRCGHSCSLLCCCCCCWCFNCCHSNFFCGVTRSATVSVAAFCRLVVVAAAAAAVVVVDVVVAAAVLSHLPNIFRTETKNDLG